MVKKCIDEINNKRESKQQIKLLEKKYIFGSESKNETEFEKV